LKNKTKTYVLLIVVISVWGVIGYQVWTGLNQEIPEVEHNGITIAFNPKNSISIDTFSVQIFNRDPFLGTLIIKSNNKRAPRKLKVLNKILWLPISYDGLIQKRDSRQKVFVITISGKQHLIKRGQSIDSVSLVRGNAKSIVVKYKNQQKTFNIQQ